MLWGSKFARRKVKQICSGEENLLGGSKFARGKVKQICSGEVFVALGKVKLPWI
ncbi:MAG: hypothetical protein KBC30_01285 [Planctomycetes bacterium]|nr:hypothetical protein [Planctomycetota bacterium]